MNKIITIVIKGSDYNHTFIWKSVEQFVEAVNTNTGLPNESDIVDRAYIDDNLVDIGSTFGTLLGKLKMVLNI